LNEEDIPHFIKTISNALNEDIPFETIFRIRLVMGKYINTKAIVDDSVTENNRCLLLILQR
jgi:hypothetical protein